MSEEGELYPWSFILFIIVLLIYILCFRCCIEALLNRKYGSEFYPWSFILFIIVMLIFISCFRCCIDAYANRTYRTAFFPWGLIAFIIILILFTSCFQCCNEANTNPVYRTPVVVTSATHTAPGGYPRNQTVQAPYPTGAQTIVVYPTANTGYQQQAQHVPYPTSGYSPAMPMPMQQAQVPYPIGQPSAMPMPQPQVHPYPSIGINQQVMPPYPQPGFNVNPPSYDSAVGTNQAAYEKQAPYNPSYSTRH